MDEPETKTCDNCKREIPVGNYTIHSVHCSRNIKMCPVCKEPFPLAELDKHHQKMHTLLPCQKCGENVCGTDMEDHVRDSCSHTVQSCRFCSLELPRRELPAHEAYCGVRTEQCADCGEWVMLRYRQLHLDSNHGFLRLDDDPDPRPRIEPLRRLAPTNLVAPIAAMIYVPPAPNGNQPNNGNVEAPRVLNAEAPRVANAEVPRIANAEAPRVANAEAPRVANAEAPRVANAEAPRVANVEASRVANAVAPRAANVRNVDPLSRVTFVDSARLSRSETERLTNSVRTANRGGSSTSSTPSNSAAPSNIGRLSNHAAASSSAGPCDSTGPSSTADPQRLPKRTNDQPQINTNTNPQKNELPKKLLSQATKKRAPQPPDPRRDVYSALRRHEQEERRRRELDAVRVAQGLSPLFSATEKLERVRKMAASLQGRGDPADGRSTLAQPPASPDHRPLQELQPMSEEQFMRRFSALQLAGGCGGAGGAGGSVAAGGSGGARGSEAAGGSAGGSGPSVASGGRRVAGSDRISEIKSSLRELRRGLNEVTAPYNSNAAANEPGQGLRDEREEDEQWWEAEWQGNPNDNHNDEEEAAAAAVAAAVADEADEADEAEEAAWAGVQLPCEFCERPQPVADLVRHQTGCRPDLARVERPPRSPRSPRPSPRSSPPPVIPCEFCAVALPLHLVSAHQERCRRNHPEPMSLD